MKSMLTYSFENMTASLEVIGIETGIRIFVMSLVHSFLPRCTMQSETMNPVYLAKSSLRARTSIGSR